MTTILHIPNKLIKACYSQWGLNKWYFKEITGSKASETKGAGSKDSYRFAQEISLDILTQT